jgi:serine phosphatase RsbU (regulator of sigma subunit)/putative methionine-R-sulfoxide reductase with GAF domain
MSSTDTRARLIAVYSLTIGVAGWALLLHLTRWETLRANLYPLLLFAVLSLIIKRFGVHVARDVTHSLVGVVDLAAVLALGPVVGAWAGVLSGFVYLELRAVRHRLFSWRFMGEHPLFSSGLKAFMALGCGALYARLGGTIPPTVVTWPMLLPLVTTLLVWFVADHVGWALRALLRAGLPGLLEFLSRILTYSVLVELVPLPFAIVIALAYVGMGEPAFFLLALALLASGALLQRVTEVGERLKERVAELAVLNEFGRRLVEAQLDVNQLCDLLYEYSTQAVEAPMFALELVDAERNLVDVVIHTEHGQRYPRRTLPMTGTMQWIGNKREPFLSGNVRRDGLPFEPLVAGEMPQSLAMIPLLAGPQLIGVLSVQSYALYAFDQDELHVLSAMANQAAMAISKARVYETEQRRSRQLAAIHGVSQRVASILELDRLFAYVVKTVQETFHYYHVGIFTVDADSGEATFRASTNPVIQEQGMEIRRGEGIIAWVAEHGEPILANDVKREARFCYTDVLADTRAELAVPLLVEKRIVGVLDVQSNTSDVFGQEDLFVLQTLADQVAIAVEDARLYAARQEEAWSSTALLQVAEAVGSLDSLDEILETVARITSMLVGVDRCSILLWDEELQEFATAQAYSIDKNIVPLLDSAHFHPGEVPLLDDLRATKSMVGMDDETHTLAEKWQVGSWLALPLREQAELHGAMLVDYVNPKLRFSERKKTILAGIADQAAMAIANARLHVAQREEAWVSTALLQVAQAFVSSEDLHDNVSRIARLTSLLVGVDRCMVFLWDKERGEFVAYEAQGMSVDDEQAFRSLHFKPGELPLLDEVQRRKGYVAVEDTQGSTLIPQGLRNDFHIGSVLAVPLLSKGEMQGALLVDYAQGPRHFPVRRISIIEGIAYQTAIAIENARLYQASLEQERSAEELRVAREIQISFLPERCPYHAHWEIAADWHAARGVGGDFYDFIPLGREHLGLVIADVSDKGMAAAMFMSMSRTLVRAAAATTRSPARTLQRVNELIMTDTRSGMFVTVFYGVLHWRSGALTYASAGHNPPVLWRHNAPQATSLTAKGIALGVIDDITLEERKIAIEPGDILVLYTDGVTEPINAQEEEFGEERLKQVIARSHDEPCDKIVKRIHAAVLDFTGDQPLFDDYTLLGVKRTMTSDE